MAVTPNLTNHLPLKICNMEVQFVDSFTYLGTLIMNYSAMYGLSNPLFRKHMIITTKINIQYVAPWLSPFCWMALKHGLPVPPSSIADRRRLDMFNMRCQNAPPACVLDHMVLAAAHQQPKYPWSHQATNRIIWKAFVSGLPTLESKEGS